MSPVSSGKKILGQAATCVVRKVGEHINETSVREYAFNC